ncbi:hypothetical protein A3G63_02760 [Candidatus Kaiserbacteria bacterium RIFCSPLOWO2_12_FULL_52_8]|nr:MAG: hypothetical protein A3G63_02760 [Candidatus Kaiserbacteria bacterium RIFCSPLOWO2_12_FULL_52_8]
MLRHKLFLFSTLALFIGSVAGVTPHAVAATLSLSSGDSATIGQTIQIPLLVSTEGSEVLNAVSAEVRFPPQALTLQSISKVGSVMSFWAEDPSFSNSNGTASLQGVVPNPGWSGQSGTVVTFVFKVKASGTATISFSSASILANDGLGSNILSKTYAKTLSLGDSAPEATSPGAVRGAPLAPVITSSTHPNPSTWYKNGSPLFSWKVPTDIIAARLLYDRSPVSSPSILYSPAVARKQLTDVSDGTYYFHAQFENASGWGAVSHIRFQIDTTAPKPFSIAVVHQSDTNSPQATISFRTSDATSGVDHYTVTIGDADPVIVLPSEIAKGPYALSVEESGQQTVVVKAYDRAGNTATDSITLDIVAIESPTITTYSQQLRVGDPFSLSGTTYPGASVLVTIKDSSGDIETESTVADGSGSFSLAWTKHLDAGAYSFTAVTRNAAGATSLPTESHIFVVAGTPLAQWGSTVFGYLLFAFAVVAAVVLVVGASYILWYRLSHLRRRLKQLTVRSGRGAQHDFELIMDDLHSLAVLLHKAKQRRQLTQEEDVILEKLKLHLRKLEDDILTRLEQIDDEAGG